MLELVACILTPHRFRVLFFVNTILTNGIGVLVQVCALNIFRHTGPKWVLGHRTHAEMREPPSERFRNEHFRAALRAASVMKLEGWLVCL